MHIVSKPQINPVYTIAQGKLEIDKANLSYDAFSKLESLRLSSKNSHLAFDPNRSSLEKDSKLRTALDIRDRDNTVIGLFAILDSKVQQVASKWNEEGFPYKSREQLLHYGPGDAASLHIDDQFYSPESQGPNKYVMHLLNQMGAILYVSSEDLVGGELKFPNQNSTILPITGTVVIYPSNCDFPHQVMPIISGHRYALVRHYYFHDTPSA